MNALASVVSPGPFRHYVRLRPRRPPRHCERSEAIQSQQHYRLTLLPGITTPPHVPAMTEGTGRIVIKVINKFGDGVKQRFGVAR